ncbi:P-loop containing nucleoside triphosphate hydrolase protein [Mycena filopes]|nr:P-loop containing nucleoside triphosphate hydrolase protein [Mycena filopes]
MLQVLVIIWLFVAVMSTLATRIMADTAFTLKGYLRAHFLPQLVRASLRLDLSALTSRKALRSLPQEYGFEMEVPGFRFFHEIITRLRNLLTVLSEVGVLVMIICRRGVHETQLLVFFVFLLPVVMLLKPNGGFGGAGFVFWTPNRNFYYLAALYKMAFSRDFRPTLARDGLCAYIAEEYQRISAELGYQNVETLGLQPAVPGHWYWDLIYHLMVDYPLAVCALMLPWAEPLSSLVSMVLVQHATTTLKQSIEQLRWAQSPDTLVEVLESAEQLYEAIAFDSELNRGTIAEDDFAIPGEHLTISDVDVEIPAGSLAVVSPRAVRRTNLIDDEPLEAYDVDSVRGAMACISQREEMYPLTLRHNLLMGAGRDAKRDEEILATAARLGCSADFIDALPAKFDTVLDPAPVTAQSIQGCGNAYITPAAMHELETHGPNFMPTFLAEGDRQRLAATRMFARLLQQKDRIRLIVCDEATREMDPRDEREFLRNVKELGAGKTIIFVTHRFGDLVKEADVILVMKDGKVVQQGTHTELMQEGERSGGCREYAEMYHAQAAGFV